jgi:hypothetical protein
MSRDTEEEKPVCVVLDTQIWLRNSLLKNPSGAALLFHLRQIGGCIGLPEVLEDEVIKNIVKMGREKVNAIQSNYEFIFVLIGSRDDYQVPSESDFESSARSRLQELNDLLTRVPFTIEHAKSALRRVNEESPPNASKNQQFKDSAVWEAVLELSRSYNIHFVTDDRNFFESKDPNKGLAQNLKEDCASLGALVFSYNDLSSFLTSFKELAPPLDDKELVTIIDSKIRDEINEFGNLKEFSIGQLIDFSVSAFLTEKRDILALQFEHIYEALDTSLIDYVSTPTDSVKANGDCLYDLSSKIVSDVRLTGLEYRKSNGELIGSKSKKTVFAEGIISLGRRKIEYRFKKPI